MTEKISRIDRLIAESDITRLIQTYSHRLDDGDFDAVGTMFENATWQLSPEVRTTGKLEKVAYLERSMTLYDGRPGTRHLLSSIVVDVSDDGLTAHSFSYIHTTQVVDGFPLQLIYQGRYEDTFSNLDGEWTFTARVVHSDGAGDMSAHRNRIAG